jgi:hypothetical protein
VGDARPPPFTMSTITHKVAVSAPSERADTISLYLLYAYMYSMGHTVSLEGMILIVSLRLLSLWISFIGAHIEVLTMHPSGWGRENS